MRGLALVLVLGLLALPAWAEPPPSNCIALSQATPGLQFARFDLTPDQVRIRYLDHASFAIQTETLMVVTDYTGQIGQTAAVPDVVTMNNAHDSHYTSQPDPRIPLVLKGWPDADGPAAIDLDLGALRLRNVTSDTRGPFGEGAVKDGNSIFLFEAAGLCIGHLGHLHQIPTPAQYAAIGRLDVVMVPVDGAFTMSQDVMADVVRRLRPRIVIPMHWFSDDGLARFLAALQDDFRIVLSDKAEVLVSLDSLPDPPQVLVLQPRPFAPEEDEALR